MTPPRSRSHPPPDRPMVLQMLSSAPAPRTLRPLAGALVALVALASLAGCGVRSDHTAGAGEGDGEATLPTLPPVEERQSALYDEDGCLVLAEGRDCGATADDLDEALAGDESDRTLAGFEGPLFTTDVSAGVVHVLDDTVAVSTSGPWRAQGLVRNETTSPVVAATVTAVLRDGAGAELERVKATSPVAPVRPGEPAPFVLEGTVDAAAVASVEWSATDGGGAALPGTRDLELTTYFVEAAGARDAIDLGVYAETGPGPHPFVLYGSITDLAGIDATRPAVVGAWLGDDGRVRAVSQADAVRLDGSPADSLGPDELADFVLVVGGDAGGLEAAPVLLWAVSR